MANYITLTRFVKLFILMPFSILFSQNVGIGTSNPHPTAKLDVVDTQRGLLIPRMSTAQRDAITNPAHSLLIFNTTTNCFETFMQPTNQWHTVWCLCSNVPLAPTASNATNVTASSFQANWSTVPNATIYFLDVATDNAFTNYVSGYQSLNVGNVTSYIVNVPPGCTYYYRIRASNECGIQSINSNVISVNVGGPIGTPTANAATSITSNSFVANWNAVSGASSYVIDVSTNPSFTNILSSYNNLNVGNVTSYTITGLNSCFTYYYRVRAISACNTASGNSNTVAVTTQDALNTSDYEFHVFADNTNHPSITHGLHLVYDVETDSWCLRPNVPTARFHFGAAYGDNGKIYVMGGWIGPPYSGLATNEEYDPVTNTWQTRASMPQAKGYFGSAAPGDGFVYALIGSYPSNCLRNTVRYDVSANSWQTLANYPYYGSGLDYIDAVSYGNNIYTFGGLINCNNTYSDYTSVYDRVNNSWSLAANMPWSAAQPGAALHSDNRIYVMGGYNGSYLSNHASYDPALNAWQNLASMPGGRYCPGVVSGGSSNPFIYCIGGYSSAGSTNTNYRYNPSSNTWITMNSIPYNLGHVEVVHKRNPNP